MPYSNVVTNWNSYPAANLQVAVSGSNYDAAGDLASNADLTNDPSGVALYSRFDNSTGTKYLLLRAAVNSSFSQKLIINFDVDAGTGLDGKIDFALVADMGALPNSYTSGTPVADGLYVAGSQSGSVNTRPNNTDFYLAAQASVQSALKIADSAIAKTTILGTTYVDLIINFNNMYTLLQDASSTDGDAQVVASPYPNFNENTPIRFALTSSANLNNVNKDISGTPTNDLAAPWTSYLSSTASFTNLVTAATPPNIVAIPENAGGGINATEAADGTLVTVDLTGTSAVAGNILTLTWGGQAVTYTLTATDITNNSATVTVSAATITTQGNGTFNVTAKIGSGTASAAFPVTVDTIAPTAPTISSIPENAGGGINATEAADGTIVNVSLVGTGAIAGNILTVNWGTQTTTYTLTATDITANNVAFPVSATTIAAQGNGTLNVTAKLTDSVGNTSANSAPSSVTVDTAAPLAPTIASIPEATGGLNATEAADGTLVNVSLAGTGASAGNTLTLSWGTQTITYTLTATDITNNSAAVAVPASTITAQGNTTFNVIAKLTDQAGNVSSNSNAFPVSVDTIAPTAPSISTIAEATDGLNATEAADGTTVNVSLTGTGAVAGDTLILNWGGESINYVLTSSNISSGSVALTVPASTISAQGNGNVNVTASLIDKAGNVSPTSTAFPVTIDTSAPAAPAISSIPEATNGINGVEAADGTIVNVSLAGTGAVAGDKLTVLWGTQTVSYTLTASDITSNTVAVTVSTATIAAQGDGSFNVTAQITDQAGNNSPTSSAFSVAVDQTSPTAPSISSIPEATGGLNSTEASDGTVVSVALTGTGSVAGDILTINWGAQTVTHTLTSVDITSGSAIVTVPVNTITAQGQGAVSVTAQVRDQAGNSSPTSNPVAVTVDTIAPTAPPTIDIPEATGGIDATEASDGTTVNVSLTGTGAVAGDTLTISWGTQTVQYTLTDADITGSSAAVTVPASTISSQGDGNFNVTVKLVDQAGNVSPDGSPFAVTVNTAPANAPTISIAEAIGGLNSTEAADGTPVVVNISTTGAVAGDTLSVNWGPQVINYTLTANDINSGSVSVTIPTNTIDTEGNGSVKVSAHVGASPSSSLLTVLVDTVAPIAPAITSLPEATGGLNKTEAADGTIVNINLTGTNALAGDTLTLNWGGQTVNYILTSTDISTNGAIVTVPSGTIVTQGDATFDVTAQLTDQAGNSSLKSSPVSVTVDRTAPTAPVISSIPEADGGLNEAEASDDTPVTISLAGTGAIAGDTLVLAWGGQTLSYVLTDNDITADRATVVVPDATIVTQGDGTFNVTAKLIDQSGNSSTDSLPLSITVDTVAPTAPVIANIPEASGGLNAAESKDGTTVNVTLGLSGTGAAVDDILTVSWGGQTVDYTLTSSDITSGSVVVPVSASTISAQGDGTFNVTAKLTDQAGNFGPGSNPISVTVDTIAPSAPTITSIPEATGGINAAEAKDGTTANINLSGSGAEVGDTLTLNWGNQTVEYTLTNADIANGTTIVTVPTATITAQGNTAFNVTAQLTDSVGNVSPASAPIAVVVDTVAPTAPQITDITEAANGLNNSEAADGTAVNVSLAGTGAAVGDTVTLSWGSQTVSYVLTDSDITSESASIVVSSAVITAQGNGTIGVTAKLSDQAGNSSPNSAATSVTVDTTRPLAPTISSIPEAVGGINTAEAVDGTTVNVNLAGTGAIAGDTLTLNWGTQTFDQVLTNTDITNGTVAVTVPAGTISTQGNGTFNVTAKLTDQVSNSSLNSPAVPVQVDTIAPAAPSISSIPESSGGINNTEAVDGTTVNVSLAGTGAIKGDTLTLNWDGQAVNYTLTNSDIAANSATVTIPTSTISAQGDGTFNVTAQVIDQAGNSSADSSPFSATIDTTAPTAPAITSIPEGTDGIDATEASDGTTVDVGLTGTGAIAGDTLILNWGTQTVNYILTDADITATSATITVSTSTIATQGDGTFDISAKIVDRAGNTSPNSATVPVTVNTVVANAPSISIPEAAGGLNSTEAADGTSVLVNLNGTGATAGNTLAISWGSQTVNYVLTSNDITSNSATVLIPVTTITAQGNSTYNVSAQIGSGPSSFAIPVTVDTTAPTAPTIASIPEASGGLNKTEAADGTLVNVSLAGTGALAGDSLTLNWGNQLVSYTLTSTDITNNSATVTVPASTITTQGDGTFNVTAKVIDQAGNSSPDSAPAPITVDTIAPTVPAITTIPEATGGINGAEAADGTTVDASLTGTGALAGDTVTLNWGTQTVSYILTDSDVTRGITIITVPVATIAAQGDSTFKVTTELLDQAGNSSPISTPTTVTVDTIAPAAPVINIISEATGGISQTEASDGTTVDVNLTGTGALSGDVLTLNWGAQTVNYTLTDSDITNSSAMVTVSSAAITAQGEGNISVTAKITDQAGNIGSLSPAVSAIVDTTLPTLTSAAVNGTTLTLNYSELLNSGFTPSTDAYTITVNGTAAAVSAIALNNSTVTLTLANPVNQDDTVAASYTQPGSNLTQDAAGNPANSFTNQAIINNTGDTTSPTLTSLTSSSLILNNATVDNGTFTLTAVYSEAMNTAVNPTLSFPTAGEDPASTISFASGNWTNSTTYVATYNVADANTNLANIDVQITGAKDGAGNLQTSANFADLFGIDTLNPTVSLSSDAPTEVKSSFTVTASFSEAVTGLTSDDITVSNGTITTAPTSDDGGITYRFTVSPNATGVVNVELGANIAQDKAGNSNSAAPSGLNRTANLTTSSAPSSPVLSSSSDTGASNSDNLTSDNTPTLIGTATANTTIKLFNGTTLLDTTTTGADGKWSFTPQSPLPDGVYQLSSAVVDSLGNTSPTSTPLTITIDATPPTAVLDVSAPPTEDNPQGKLVIRFNEPIKNFDLSDLALTHDGALVSLEGATLTSPDGMTWTIGNLNGRTNEGGNYTLAFTSTNDISDLLGNRFASTVQGSWTAEECQLGEAIAIDFTGGGKRGKVQKGNSSKNRLSGTRRNDLLRGYKGNDILKGKSGNDRLVGDSGKDVLTGDSGNDRLLGGSGNDRLTGGRGNDRLTGGRGNDRLSGGTGHDLIKGDLGNDRLSASSGNDILVGGRGRDRLTGGRGQDMFVFNTLKEGVDHITDFNVTTDLLDLRPIFARKEFGGAAAAQRFHGQLIQRVQVGANTEIRVDSDGLNSGSNYTTLVVLDNVSVGTFDCINLVLTGDACRLAKPTPIRFNVGKRGVSIRGTSGNDRLSGKNRNDRLVGGTGNDIMKGNAGADRLFSGSGNDVLDGGSGRDQLTGGIGQDRLLGQRGSDVLIGGSGQDILTGGRDKDLFVFEKLSAEGDRITDFNVRQDALDLRRIFAKPAFAGGRAHALHTQLIQSVQMGADTQIQVDADGIGAGKTFVTLATLQNVTATAISCRNFAL
ncbi:hypothetical protein H6G00_08515 [Leptolyngbya sp. FACHB-541]|uniref:Ig-like domain-containing protein n=1 Tax=Leptolyngbya sp. FACHB-541 TaxID=2692810 RepID=UPI0016844DFC|nr:Ig-like domain-containing protein [Leptolyngbya sp. FACHB-541]MBD1996659.1 hypothetical protein [Leptolyngbya sp. FACHB-541]